MAGRSSHSKPSSPRLTPRSAMVPVLPADEVRRIAVEQFIGQHQPVEVRGQGVQPVHPRASRWHCRRDCLSLPFTLQLAGEFENQITLGRGATLREVRPAGRRRAARACADLRIWPRADSHDLRDLRRQRLREAGVSSGAVTKSPAARQISGRAR